MSIAVLTTVHTERVQGWVKKIPLIGYYLTCDNHDCKGVCHKCADAKRLQKAVIGFSVQFIPAPKR